MKCPFFFVILGKNDEDFLLYRLYHAPCTDDNEGNRQQLSHVEKHAFFKCLLHFFRVFDEEAEGEDIGQAETEIEAGAHLRNHSFA